MTLPYLLTYILMLLMIDQLKSHYTYGKLPTGNNKGEILIGSTGNANLIYDEGSRYEIMNSTRR